MIGRLTLRADCSRTVGAGHVMRMIALGQAWRDRGGTVRFLGSVPGMDMRIEEDGFTLVPLSDVHPDGADLTRVLAETSPGGWVVLDGYHFDGGYQCGLWSAGRRVLVLDDVCDRGEYCADVLVNQNADAREYAYPINGDAALLLGTRYALLRREFVAAAPRARDFSTRPLNLVVTFGGADIYNWSGRVLEAVGAGFPGQFNVRVVAGAVNPHLKALAETVKGFPGECRLLHSVGDMAALFDWADLALSAAGSTCWELCRMGVPMWLLILADNQMGIGTSLEANGVARIVDAVDGEASESWERSLLGFLSDTPFHQTASRAAPAMVDGRGAYRIVDFMLARS
ncbi:MAG: UDP-2,4-diacetamido-2,4,6-trideoxy-beta-L-altropyranose hydrolase [Pseudodesulfovibrio sp.]